MRVISINGAAAMFFFRHPKPVGSQKAVATQVVQRKTQTGMVDKHTIIVETRKPEAPLAKDEIPVKD